MFLKYFFESLKHIVYQKTIPFKDFFKTSHWRKLNAILVMIFMHIPIIYFFIHGF